VIVDIAFTACAFMFVWYAKPRILLTTLLNNNTALHLFLASTLTITLLAFIQGGAMASMPLHFLGLSAATLILGRNFAILAATLCCLILILAQKLMPSEIGITLIGGMFLPIVAVDYWRKLVIPTGSSVFRFVFLGAAAGAILSLLIKTLLLALYYLQIGDIEQSLIWEQYILLSLLFWVPEIMLNSTIILTLAQHKPQWLASYHASHTK